jgi:outer membrane protein
MKRSFLLFLFGLAATSGFAQTTPSAFNLDQCITYALENAINSQNATLDERIAAARVKETIGIGLPQVSASASVQYNERLRRFFTTYTGPGGFFDFSGVPGIQVGDVVSAENFFQLKSSGDVGLNIDQLIFDGSYLVGLQAAGAYKELATKQAIQTRESIIENVTKAYYAVLINRERIDLFNSNIARVDSLLKNTRALNQAGFSESIDVDRIRVSLNNLRTEREKFNNLNLVALLLLKFQMNYPMDQPLEVMGNIQDVQVNVNLDDYIRDWDYKIRPDYQVLQSNYRLQQLNLKNQYAGAVPSISAFANLGYATQSPNVGGLFSTNSQIEDGPQVGPDKWYGYSLFGVNLNWRIFTGTSRSFKIQQEKLTLSKIENGFKALKNTVDLEVQQSTLKFQNALIALAAQQENQDLASNVARVTKIKYEQGVGSNLEVVTAEDALKEAQINYYSALFDAMIAKVDLDKAYGKLIPSAK